MIETIYILLLIMLSELIIIFGWIIVHMFQFDTFLRQLPHF